MRGTIRVGVEGSDDLLDDLLAVIGRHPATTAVEWDELAMGAEEVAERLQARRDIEARARAMGERHAVRRRQAGHHRRDVDG